MKIITRYIVKEFFKLWLPGVIALGGLVLISEFFRELRLYLSSKAGFFTVGKVLLFSFPHWAMQGLPLATMLSALFVLTRMEHQNELCAIKSSGININIVIRPLLICGIGITLFALISENFLIPHLSRRARLLKEEKILHHPVLVFRDYSDLVAISPEREVYAGKLNTSHQEIKQLLVVFPNQNGKIQINVSPVASFSENSWILPQALIYELDNVTSTVEFKKMDKFQINLDISPLDLLPRPGLNPEEMTFSDYKMFLENLRKLGYWQTKTWIQFYRKFSEPLTNLVVILIAIVLGLSFSGSFSRLFNFTISLILAAIYSLLSALGESLGEMGVISPVMAASFGLIIFGFLTLFALSWIRR